jgi:phage terminase large subunit
LTAQNNIQVTQVFNKNWQAATETIAGKRKYRYIVNSGSSRSSKTYSLLQLFYLYAYTNPNKKLSVFRETKKNCKATVFEDMKKAFPSMPGYRSVVLNITESIFKFANGSTIHIEGTDDSVKVHGYHCDVLWLNEPYTIGKDTFDQLDMRCADFVLMDINPRQAHWSEALVKDGRAKLIHSTFKDNPFCPIEQRAKILSYQPLKHSEIVESKLLTEETARHYDTAANSSGFTDKQINELARCRLNEAKNSADSFNWNVYALGLKAEQPNRIFKWDEIPEHEYHSLNVDKYYGVDWGTADPWAIVEAKYYDGGLYLHELNYLSENQIREKLTHTELQNITAQDEGIVSFMFNKLGIDNERPIVCDSNRPTKIAMLRRCGWSQATSANKAKGSIIDGIDLLKNLKVYYTHTSLNIKYEQENYRRKLDSNNVVLDEPEDCDNHCFIGSTKISTPFGQKNMADLMEGDLVLTQYGINKIVKKFSNGTKEVCKYYLNLEDNKTQIITCTPDHKIHTQELGWIPISSLKKGMTVTHIRNLTVVMGVQEYHVERQPVFDLMVENDHSYFAENILVHNCMDTSRYIANYLQRVGVIRKV